MLARKNCGPYVKGIFVASQDSGTRNECGVTILGPRSLAASGVFPHLLWVFLHRETCQLSEPLVERPAVSVQQTTDAVARQSDSLSS